MIYLGIFVTIMGILTIAEVRRNRRTGERDAKLWVYLLSAVLVAAFAAIFAYTLINKIAMFP